MDAVSKFRKLLEENDLMVTLGNPIVRFVDNGGLLVEPPQLTISYKKGKDDGTTQQGGETEDAEIDPSTQNDSQS